MEAVTAPPQTPTLDSPELYTNRELSWLKFNERVLELAEDETTPLLERVKFLAIYANNLDEFFMVRVAGLYDQVDAGIDARGPDGLSPSEAIERIVERARELGRRHSRQWEDHVRPALAEHGIRVIDCDECDGQELEQIDRQFSEQIFPGMEVLRHDNFRVTRDADFTVSDEAAALLQAVEDELRRRRFGGLVRFE